jgi:hypothetical protein
MNEWLLFNANSAIYQLYHDKNIQWNDDEVRFGIRPKRLDRFI